MLLKDCPVGSVVRLKTLCGYDVGFSCWLGEFEVKLNGYRKYITDNNGYNRYGLEEVEDYQFEIVSLPNTPNNRARQITIDGVTYKLTPTAVPKNIEIDGVVYKMEPV